MQTQATEKTRLLSEKQLSWRSDQDDTEEWNPSGSSRQILFQDMNSSSDGRLTKKEFLDFLGFIVFLHISKNLRISIHNIS